MTTLPLLVLLGVAVLGAGLVPGVAPPVAVALLAAACLRPLPTRASFRCGVWLLLILALWTAATAFPAGFPVGDWRVAFGAEASSFLARYGDLCGQPAGVPAAAQRLSLHPSGTLRWLILLLGAAGMFCLVASLRTRQRILLVKGLAVLGGGVAIAGILGRVLIPQDATLVWWYPVSEIGGGNPLGPFVNRNHFAALCALLAPLALALTCHASGPGWGGPGPADDRHGGTGFHVSPGERLLYGACLAAMAAGVFVSRSRGGTAALLLGTVVMALLWLRRGPGAAALATLAGVGAITLVTLWPDPDFQGRLHGMRDAPSAVGARWPIWRDCGRVWTQVPLAGCGANAFGMVFPRVTTWATGEQATHAESDVIQVLAEGGTLGALLALGGLLAVLAPLMEVLVRRHRRRPSGPRAAAALELGEDPPASALHLPYPLLAAVGSALAAITLASLVDIPLRVPLGAWTAAAVLGLAAPPPPRHGRSYPRAAWLGPERLAPVALLAVALLIGWKRPGWRALYRDRDAWLDSAGTGEIAALLSETPTYWQAWYALGDRLFRQARTSTGPDCQRLREAAWLAMRSAVRCNPRDPRLRGALARLLWQDRQWDAAREHRDVQIALCPGDQALRRHWLEAEWRAGFTALASQLAFRLADEAGAAGTEGAGYLAWLAERELAEGSVTRARRALQAARARCPDDARLVRGLAECDRRLGDTAGEAQWLRVLVRDGHADAAAWWRLAEFALAAADRSGLQEALGMAVQLDPARRRAADELWKSFVERLRHSDPSGAPGVPAR